MRLLLVLLFVVTIFLEPAHAWHGFFRKYKKNKRPVVKVSLSKRRGTSPLQVRFDLSKSYDRDGYIKKFYINFGDGNKLITNERIINHTYINNKKRTRFFLPRIFAIDNQNKRSFLKFRFIIVRPGTDQPTNNPPIASFEFPSGDHFAPVDLSLASTSSDPDGDAISYNWEIEGQVYSTNAITHTFSNAGIIPIKLTVTDSKGASNSIEKSITMLQNSAPIASFDIDKTEGDSPLDISASSTSTDAENNITSYSWLAGDGSAAINGNSFNYTYTTPGEYKLELTVTDSKGLNSKYSQIITVLTPLVPAIEILGFNDFNPGGIILGVSNLSEFNEDASISWSTSFSSNTSSENEVTLSGIPVGDHSISLQIISGGKTYSSSIDITIKENGPFINGEESISVFEGRKFLRDFIIQNPKNEEVTTYTQPQINGVTFTNGRLEIEASDISLMPEVITLIAQSDSYTHAKEISIEWLKPFLLTTIPSGVSTHQIINTGTIFDGASFSIKEGVFDSDIKVNYGIKSDGDAVLYFEGIDADDFRSIGINPGAGYEILAQSPSAHALPVKGLIAAGIAIQLSFELPVVENLMFCHFILPEYTIDYKKKNINSRNFLNFNPVGPNVTFYLEDGNKENDLEKLKIKYQEFINLSTKAINAASYSDNLNIFVLDGINDDKLVPPGIIGATSIALKNTFFFNHAYVEENIKKNNHQFILGSVLHELEHVKQINNWKCKAEQLNYKQMRPLWESEAEYKTIQNYPAEEGFNLKNYLVQNDYSAAKGDKYYTLENYLFGQGEGLFQDGQYIAINKSYRFPFLWDYVSHDNIINEISVFNNYKDLSTIEILKLIPPPFDPKKVLIDIMRDLAFPLGAGQNKVAYKIGMALDATAEGKDKERTLKNLVSQNINLYQMTADLKIIDLNELKEANPDADYLKLEITPITSLAPELAIRLEREDGSSPIDKNGVGISSDIFLGGSGSYETSLSLSLNQGSSKNQLYLIMSSADDVGLSKYEFSVKATAVQELPPPNATFTYELVNGSVLFDATDPANSQRDDLTYSWDFGDGSSQETTNEKITHGYSKQIGDSYAVTLTVKDPSGNEVSYSTTIDVAVVQLCNGGLATQHRIDSTIDLATDDGQVASLSRVYNPEKYNVTCFCSNLITLQNSLMYINITGGEAPNGVETFQISPSRFYIIINSGDFHQHYLKTTVPSQEPVYATYGSIGSGSCNIIEEN